MSYAGGVFLFVLAFLTVPPSYSFSINHYGTLYATGEEFTPARKLGWFTDDEVCKSAKKTGGPDRTAG